MSDTTGKRLKVSREGVVLIKSFEGFRASAQPRPDGGWVIGYGHTRSAREGLTVSEADAELLLQYDLIPVVSTLNDQAPSWVNQHQFDALASYAFSIGLDRFQASPVLERLRAGAADEAADAMVGSPEIAPADAVVRRRAAERALFVADIGSPVTLAQLMSAPLPLPVPSMVAAVEPIAVEPEAIETPLFEAESAVEFVESIAIVEGVAAELEVVEPAVEDGTTTVEDEPTPPPVADLNPGTTVDGLEPVDATLEDPEIEAVEAAPEVATVSVDAPVESRAEAEAPVEVADAPAAAELADVADSAVETYSDTPLEMGATVEPKAPVEEASVEAEPAPKQAPAPKPIAASAAASLRLSPYPGVIVGPIPGLAGAMSGVTPASLSGPVNAAAPVEADVPSVVAEPLVEAERNTFESTPAPVLDAPGLVLTPPDEIETPILRPLWSEADRGITAADESPLFEEVLHPAATAVLRHEAETAPRRTDWSEFGAFAAMGGIGLVSFGAAVAGFRKAAEKGPDGAQLAMVGWVLLLIALICVGVSGYNLFRTWTADRKAD